jgi:hypothetical protein
VDDEDHDGWQGRSGVPCIPDDAVQAADLLVGAGGLTLVSQLLGEAGFG